jgi:hypothetical protein
MNFKTTCILLVLLLGAGAYLYFGGAKENPPTEEKESGGAKKLLTIKSADVKKLTITPADGKKIIFVRDQMNWKITEPIAAPAEAGTVNTLLDELVAMQSTNTTEVSDGSGLKSPRYVVDLDADGKVTTVSIGDKSTVGDRLYVQVKGNPKADLVSSSLLQSLDKPLEEFRDKQLITLAMPQVKYVAIQQPSGKLEASEIDGKWQVTSPTTMPGDEAAITDLIGEITRLRATEFVPGSPTTPLYGLRGGADETTFVTVSTSPTTQPATTQPATSYTIALGRPDSMLKKNVFATVQGSNSVMKIAKDSLAFLDHKPAELRDKTILDVDPSAVNIMSVIVDSPATTQPTTRPAENKQYVVKRRPPPATQPATTQASTQPAATTWMTLDGKDANDAAVSSILNALHPLKAEKYVESAPAGGKTIDCKLETGGTGVRPLGHTEFKIFVQGEGKPPIGVYNGLSFDLDRSLVERLEADFSKPGPPPTPASPAPEMGGPMGPMTP